MNFLFNQKKKILPLLSGSVDIHCHILPGIDDGSKSVAESKVMIDAYHELGFKKIIATPHIMKGTYPNTKETISNSFEELKKGLGNQVNLIHNTAAEYMIDEDFEGFLDAGSLLPLKDKFILVEMSYFQQPINFQQNIFKLLHNGFVPILAHPERYNFIKNIEEYYELKAFGCMFQLNLLSLTDHYGEIVRKKASLLLKKNLYNFLATDAHHVRHLMEIKEIGVSKAMFSQIEQVSQKNIDVFM